MVKNMEESLKFYQDIIGLRINRVFSAGSGTEIAFLGDGTTNIELVCNNMHKNINVGEDISWAFCVESLEKTIAFLKSKGIAIHSGPFLLSTNIKFVFILDPNGFKIQLVEND